MDNRQADIQRCEDETGVCYDDMFDHDDDKTMSKTTPEEVEAR